MQEVKTISALEWLVLNSPSIFEEIFRLERMPDKDLEVQKKLSALKISIRSSCVECFKKCIEEGLFITSMNYETISSIYIEEMKNLKPRFRLAMIQSFLNGLCTEKGVNELVKIYVDLKI